MPLSALRWVAQEPLVYDQAANQLHRPSCAGATGMKLAEGEAIALVWAPEMCWDCEPDVTMELGPGVSIDGSDD